MDLLIILTYTAFCISIFKIFKIPLNKWSIPTAVLGGVVLLSSIMIMMNYLHPYAKYGKEVFASIPITPLIGGNIQTIDVEPNQEVAQGDVLFTLYNDEQKLNLTKAEAALEQAKNQVLQEDESLNTAIGQVAQAEADRDRTRTTYLRYKKGHEKGGDSSPFTQQELDNRKKLYEAAEAKVDTAQANERKIRLATESNIFGENTNVAQLKAARDKAALELERTIVRAPVRGTATQVSMRPGMRAGILAMRPVLTFVPKEKRRFAARMWQNSLLRLKKGLDAEVLLDAVPGHIFKGKVVDVLPAMAEGEIQGSGSLIGAQRLAVHGFAIAIIELDEDLNDYNLPKGVQGQAVAYNHEGDFLHTSMVRQILLRMMSWIKYVYPIK
ncbi:HlyD family secretion protein [Thalassotalea sp. M1531]|uniref:HlyD family secretion protein n=1 Tax=Thalassotalea algicola TaxID=2716224 RepID=A0A7Y0Q819_9GAMM|nr:HlyD family secretion protein [Thalassotalea algicola]NMP31640.1 HlyD family secretion protein [Thalassotalea algicola]